MVLNLNLKHIHIQLDCVERNTTLCSDDYTPVCGTDGITYSNLCHLEKKACATGDTDLIMRYEGECTGEI